MEGEDREDRQRLAERAGGQAAQEAHARVDEAGRAQLERREPDAEEDGKARVRPDAAQGFGDATRPDGSTGGDVMRFASNRSSLLPNCRSPRNAEGVGPIRLASSFEDSSICRLLFPPVQKGDLE